MKWAAVALVLLGGLLLRLALVLRTPGFVAHGDGSDYLRLGHALLAGRGMPSALARGPSAFRPPGYPLLVAGVLEVHGTLTAVRVANALIGTTGALLVGVLADEAARHVRSGGPGGAGEPQSPLLVATALAALAPPFVLIDVVPMSEPLALALTAAALLAALRVRRTGSWRVVLAAGVLAGLVVLVRPGGWIVLLGVVIVVVGGSPRPLHGRLGAATVTVGLAVVLVLPWTVRNAARFGALVPVTDSSGITLAGSFNDVSGTSTDDRGRWIAPFLVPSLQPLVTDRRLDERQLDAALRDSALDYARAHPAYATSVAPRNLLRMVAGSATDTTADVAGLGLGPEAGSWWRRGSAALLALAAVGLIARRPRGLPAGLWLTGALLVVAATPAGGEMRYLLPGELVLVVAAAPGLTRLLAPRGRRERLTTDGAVATGPSEVAAAPSAAPARPPAGPPAGR